MVRIPPSVERFLRSERIAVAGVSRDPKQPANAIFRRLRETGHVVVPVNPNATEVEGQRSYRDLQSIPGVVDALMIVTHPDTSPSLVAQAAARQITNVWFHRSFGSGSVSQDALDECRLHGIHPIVGGCPMMYCGNVDIAHRCVRWWLGLQKRVPG